MVVIIFYVCQTQLNDLLELSKCMHNSSVETVWHKFGYSMMSCLPVNPLNLFTSNHIIPSFEALQGRCRRFWTSDCTLFPHKSTLVVVAFADYWILCVNVVNSGSNCCTILRLFLGMPCVYILFPF